VTTHRCHSGQGLRRSRHRFDLNPERIKEANENARQAGVEKLVKFVEKNLFDTDLREASVVTLYLLPDVNMRLRPKLLRELKTGSRIVSHAFVMGDWKPDKKIEVNNRTVYFWIVTDKARADFAQGQPAAPVTVFTAGLLYILSAMSRTTVQCRLLPSFAIGTRGQIRAAPNPRVLDVFGCLERLNQSGHLKDVLIVGRSADDAVGVAAVGAPAHQADQVGVPLGGEHQPRVRVTVLVRDHEVVRRLVKDLRFRHDGRYAGAALNQIEQAVADLANGMANQVGVADHLPCMR
jgi:hypothetical protein